MLLQTLQGVFIPFLGTSLGALCAFFLRGSLNKTLGRSLNGFAGGVMIAASVWSLLIPSIEASSHYGYFAFVPAVVGFLCGIFLMLVFDKLVPQGQSPDQIAKVIESEPSSASKNAILFFAITLHNIPEGVAVGVVFSSLLTASIDASLSEAIALSVGIAIQNFPEGAIVSMPLVSGGQSRTRAVLLGIASGIVEPIAALLTILFCELLLPVFPYLLSFAAGAMVFVVAHELIPEANEGEGGSYIGTVMLALGFCLMMSLDVALG